MPTRRRCMRWQQAAMCHNQSCNHSQKRDQPMKKSLLLIIGVLLAASLQAQSISAPELSAPVNVYIDDAGIPTIVGETESDVNFVRGFLHARDRLFHMDYLRRVSSGTLAELLGPARSEEHTSELQSRGHIVCRLLL